MSEQQTVGDGEGATVMAAGSAEDALAGAQAELEAVRGELEATRETVRVLERRQRIDALLAESEAIDLEAARLLTERAVEVMDEPDVEMAVQDLRRGKPYLFRQRRTGHVGAMAARQEPHVQPAEEAAERAARSGNRRDLLAYLRLRRK